METSLHFSLDTIVFLQLDSKKLTISFFKSLYLLFKVFLWHHTEKEKEKGKVTYLQISQYSSVVVPGIDNSGLMDGEYYR